MYFFYASIIFFFQTLTLQPRQSYKTISAVFLIFIITITSAIRWRTGTDWKSYHDFFYSGGGLSSYLSYYHFEYGFKIVNWIFFSVFGSYSIFLFALTFAVITLKIRTVISKPYVLLCFLAIFGVSMGDLFPTRQALAISLVFLGAFNLSKSNFKSFFLIVILAAFFHKTAIIALFLFFVRSLSVLQCIFFSVVIFFVTLGTIYLVTDYGLPMFPVSINTQISYYLNNFDTKFSYFSISYKAGLLLYTLLAVYKVKDYLDNFELLSIKAFLIGLILSPLYEVFISSEFNRLSIFYTSFEIIAIPALFYYYFIKRMTLPAAMVFLFIIFGFYAARFYFHYINYPDLYYPFETIFDSSFREVY